MEVNSKKILSESGKGVILSVAVTLVMIFLFAIAVKLTNINYKAVKAVNQFIKIVAVFLGCFFSLKNENGIVKGGIIGILYTLVIYLLFLIFGASDFSTSFWIDLLLSMIVGVISGIITVNVKPEKNN